MINECRHHIQKIRNDFQASQRVKDSLNNSIKALARDLYSKDTHFIFELIQNAEDNTYQDVNPSLSFKLTNIAAGVGQGASGALIVHNNEIGFTSDNVEAICAVGKTTKSKIQGYIGEKGIGFKSVYRVTSNPHIYSNGYSFCMPEIDSETGLGFIVPKWIEPSPYRNTLSQTVIILPLDKPDFNYSKIELMLSDIEQETILFLSKLKQIEINMEGENSIKIEKDDSDAPLVRLYVRGNIGGKAVSKNRQLLVYSKSFARPNNIHHEKRQNIPDRVVTIAIPINNEGDETGEIFAYLPINSNTGFPFLINADFILTSSREAIQKDVPWNRWLMESVAELVVDALHGIKERNQLTIDFLENLSKGMLSVSENNILYPVKEKIKSALIDCDLLPADDGTFVPARHAKLARSADLRKLLNYEQISLLFRSPERTKWLASEITQDLTPNLKRYLTSALGVEEIRPDKFIDLLTDDFLENQNDEWIIEFYSFLGGFRPDFWKKHGATIKAKKLLRLEDGTHVVPFKRDGTPNAYLPSMEKTEFPTIKKTISGSETAVNFLKQLGIIKPDLFAEIIEFILPKYAVMEIGVDFKENINDLNKIKKVIDEPYQGSPASSLLKLRILLGKLGLTELEGYLSSKTETGKLIPLLFKLVLPSVRLVKATNGESDVYREPKNTYLRSDELDQYFDGNQKAWFVSNEYPEEILPLFHEFGINALPKVVKKGPDKNGFIKIAESHGYHKRGLEGFDPDISVDGLEIAINNPTHQKSEFIWNKIAIENWPCIAGIIEKSSKKTYENSKKESMISDFGRLLIDAKWLPDPSGDYLNPSKLSLAQLPNGFERETQRAKSLSVAIGMKQPEREQAIKIVTGGDRDLENLIDFYQAASDAERKKILKSIPQEISPEPAPSFKDALKSLGRVQSGVTDKETKPNPPVADTDRYQGKLNEDVEAGVQEHLSKSHKITFNSVRNTSSNSEARRFLYEEYKGHCQITETTFPKASKRSDGTAENYFEACALVSYSRADYLNDAGNMLCVSADTMAKLKFASVELLDDFEAIIHDFKESGETIERVSFKIRLAGENRFITWSQRHFMRLVALYEEA